MAKHRAPESGDEVVSDEGDKFVLATPEQPGTEEFHEVRESAPPTRPVWRLMSGRTNTVEMEAVSRDDDDDD